MSSDEGLAPADAFSALPDQLRSELLDAFGQIVRNYAEARWEPAELNGGKLSEIAYMICRGIADGEMPAVAAKPKNMVDTCKSLESETHVPRSIRIQVPRMLIALYEIRNNRNVGHIGGDVDPSHMDATAVLQMAKWVVAELVRVLHDLDVEDAAAIVEALVERETPLVWKVGDKKRVLDPSMSMKNRTLVLLHAAPGAVAEANLVDWVEHSNPAVYRRDILKKAHRERLLEYDATGRTATISPLGVTYVEENFLRRDAA